MNRIYIYVFFRYMQLTENVQARWYTNIIMLNVNILKRKFFNIVFNLFVIKT
jgi:hypothetical protein